MAVLAAHRVSSPESALLNAVHDYPGNSPPQMPDYAWRYYSLGQSVTEDECQAALPGCFARGWFRIVDQPALSEIRTEIWRKGLFGPVFGLPPLGGVDFTPEGARLWQHLIFELSEGVDESPYWCSMTGEGQRSLYCRSLEVAVRERDRLLNPRDNIAVTDPQPIGPWRVQWWRRYPQGYRLDMESRNQGDTFWRLNRPAQHEVTPERLRDTLHTHGVTLGEWAMLAGIDSHHNKRFLHLPTSVSRYAGGTHGIVIPPEDCCAGLAGCLRKRWLQTLNDKALEHIRSLLSADRRFPHSAASGTTRENSILPRRELTCTRRSVRSVSAPIGTPRSTWRKHAPGRNVPTAPAKTFSASVWRSPFQGAEEFSQPTRDRLAPGVLTGGNSSPADTSWKLSLPPRSLEPRRGSRMDFHLISIQVQGARATGENQ